MRNKFVLHAMAGLSNSVAELPGYIPQLMTYVVLYGPDSCRGYYDKVIHCGYTCKLSPKQYG